MTAGILGIGGIGRATGRLLRAFGVRIEAINSSGRSSEPSEFIGTLDDLERMLRASGLIVIALPLNRTTPGLIGEKELSWLKPDAILINVSRAAIINESDLYHFVKSHPNFSLGIDAWWTEPFLQGKFEMEYPFLDLPNVLGSPHNSAMVSGGIIQAARLAAENVKDYIAGKQVRGIIRREDYIEEQTSWQARVQKLSFDRARQVTGLVAVFGLHKLPVFAKALRRIRKEISLASMTLFW